jgi:2'-hydroxyisoflavone reductase
MKLLVVGGTRFVGRHVVDAALRRGHDVTLLHRGRTGVDLFPSAEEVLADRDADLSALTGRRFDATVDTCAYFPRQVRSLAAALAGGAGHYLYISSVSAYVNPPPHRNYDESAPLAQLADPDVDVVTDETYGGLKAVSEGVATALFGPATLIVRPTYVVGPDDYTWRFPWWVRRIAAGGEVVAPGPATDPAQVIDGRDQGDWIVRLLEDGAEGAFHAVSPTPPFSWGQLLQAIVDAVGPIGTSLTWVDIETLHAAGLGPGDFPLWASGYDVSIGSANPAKAYASGLSPRPLADTIRDTLAWIETQDGPPAGVGLDPQREAAILASWQAR